MLPLADHTGKQTGARLSRVTVGDEVPIFEAGDFEQMVKEERPEVVIVTTKDATHSQYITHVFPVRAPAYEVKLWPSGEGGHAGGDSEMLDGLFLPQRPADKYLRALDHRAGAYVILTAGATNHSFVTGKAVTISDLAPNLELPNYPAMPSPESPVPMPPRA